MDCTYRIMFYNNEKSYAVLCRREDPELTKQLWKYHADLGVTAYEADTEDPLETVRWELQEHWYTTSQIERIMKIRAFL